MAAGFPNNAYEDLVLKEFIPSSPPAKETTFSQLQECFQYYWIWPKALEDQAAYYMSHVSNSLDLLSRKLSAFHFILFIKALDRTNQFFLGE